MIEESKVLEFIKRNDKRIGSVLNKYDELIKRLLVEEKISLNAIYEFIFENDNSIGNKANFYKYCKRFKTKEKKTTAERPRDTFKTAEQIKTVSEHTPVVKTSHKTATDILSQDFNLLD